MADVDTTRREFLQMLGIGTVAFSFPSLWWLKRDIATINGLQRIGSVAPGDMRFVWRSSVPVGMPKIGEHIITGSQIATAEDISELFRSEVTDALASLERQLKTDGYRVEHGKVVSHVLAEPMGITGPGIVRVRG